MLSLRRVLLAVAVLLPAIALLAARAGAQVSSSSQNRPVGIYRMRGMHPTTTSAASNPNNIPYNGGPVLPVSTTYAVFWGPLADFPSDAVTGLEDFLEGLNGSHYMATANQYFFGQTAQTHFAGTLFDSSAPPVNPIDAQGNDLMLLEVFNVLAANGMQPDPNGVYFVYTSNFPDESYYCAYHDFSLAPDGVTPVQVVYAPNPSGAPYGCEANYTDPLYLPNALSEGTRAMANFSAHEFMETITDPEGTGWINPTSGDEIGDPCAFVFQTPVPLNGGKWKVQEIWSNAAGACVQGAGYNSRVIGDVSILGGIAGFDIPGAPLGIFPQSINLRGASTGFYTDANNVWHGFLRGPLGAVTNIDVPGATNTVTSGINAVGTITGEYLDANFTSHGFLRDVKGNLTFFDAPGEGVGGLTGTDPTAINASGSVTGYLGDANNVTHGFLRDSLGNFSTFDAPCAANGLFGGTFILAINASGAVVGYALDAANVNHAVLRTAAGVVTCFDDPAAANGTFAQSINNSGVIAGYYIDSRFVTHGFTRDASGNFTTIDDPNAVYGTVVMSINSSGAVAGYYSDKAGLPRGFMHTKAGVFVTLNDSSPDYGNVVRSLNDLGLTAGYVTRAAN